MKAGNLPDMEWRGQGEWLDVPFVDGKIWSVNEGILSNFADGRYCWVCEGSSRFNARGIKGIPKQVPSVSFHLVYRTGPDHQFIDFVPGVGIVGYTYVHHGTVASTELHLIEAHLNPPVPSKNGR